MDEKDRKEMDLLRELAGGQCVIPKVTAELGPMSLWSRDGLQREMARVRREALEEAAKACETVRADTLKSAFKNYEDTHDDGWLDGCNECEWAIRALIDQAPS